MNKIVQNQKMFVLLMFAALCLAMMFIPVDAFAQGSSTGFNKITGSLLGQTGGFAKLMASASYVLGIGIGVLAALKFKEYSEDTQRNKIITPIAYTLIAGTLLALPTLLTTSSEAVFGTGYQGTTLSGDSITTLH